MAKAKAKAPAAARPRRVSHDSDQLNRLLLIGGVVGVLVIAAGVIIYGWWATQVKPLGDTVLSVGETEFTLGHLERRLEQELPDDLATAGADLLTYPERVINDLEREGLLIEGSGALNITVTDEEISAEVRTRGGLAEDVEPRLYAEEFSRQVKESGLHEGEYRQQLKAEMLEERVRNYFTFLVPETEPQVRGRWIVTQDQANADAALLRLAAGEAFEDVATELSLDNVGSTREGDLPWTPRGIFGLLPLDVEDYLFSAEQGAFSDVIEADGAFYVVQVIERDDDRELDDNQRIQVGIREMNKWLEDLPNTIVVVRDFDQEDAIKALNDVT